jgi:hypothetical protein
LDLRGYDQQKRGRKTDNDEVWRATTKKNASRKEVEGSISSVVTAGASKVAAADLSDGSALDSEQEKPKKTRKKSTAGTTPKPKEDEGGKKKKIKQKRPRKPHRLGYPIKVNENDKDETPSDCKCHDSDKGPFYSRLGSAPNVGELRKKFMERH